MLGVSFMENKYYLAVEVKPKNYFPINLLDLKIAKHFTTTNLEELDAFTLKFSKKALTDLHVEISLTVNDIQFFTSPDITHGKELFFILYSKNLKKVGRNAPLI